MGMKSKPRAGKSGNTPAQYVEEDE